MTSSGITTPTTTTIAARGGAAEELARRFTWPEHLVLHGSKLVVAAIDVAHAVASDQHPGDDAVPPQWLLNSAREAVNLERLRKLARATSGRLDLTPRVLRAVVDLDLDNLGCLSNAALDDACGEQEPRGLDPDSAALVLVLGVLLARGGVA